MMEIAFQVLFRSSVVFAGFVITNILVIEICI